MLWNTNSKTEHNKYSAEKGRGYKVYGRWKTVCELSIVSELVFIKQDRWKVAE